MTAFPGMSIQRDNLRIIKLSYQKYADQAKGRHDVSTEPFILNLQNILAKFFVFFSSLQCIMVANYLCEKLNGEGEFGFYSGAAIKNANNELYFHRSDNLNTQNNEIHVSIDSKNGYMNINNLTDNEVGIVYTDCDFDVPSLLKWIQAVD